MTVLSHRAPVHIGAVSLTVHDLDGVADFYARVIGLQKLRSQKGVCELGAGDTVLLRLIADASAKPAKPGSAGLFHTAFLLPSRADLARWVQHAIDNRFAVTGASDHLVSEAIYLDDPEGNGIEIYRDREPAEWPREQGQIKMATEALDFASLLQSIKDGDFAWKGAPEQTRVGHIHLRVGNTDAAEAYYQGKLALDLVTRYPGASFLSSGGYHHHIGANVWASRGALTREPALGLASFELVADADAHRQLKAALGEASADPWANRIVLKEKQ